MKAKILVFVFILTTIFTGQINANPIKLTEEQKGIFGTWQIKKTVSEKQKAKFIPAAFSPETLILAADGEFDEITINEGFKEFVQTNTLPTDGKIISKNVFKVGKVSSRAFWQGKSLIIEINTEKGDKISESFELSANKKQLFVTIEVTKRGSNKTSKVRRVFERTADAVEENTAQVGITNYPL